MKRYSFNSNGLELSYMEAGKINNSRRVIIALHAHGMEATTFAAFTEKMQSDWRIIALDQRGHGFSEHAKTYTREDYISDILNLFKHLRLDRAVLLGNSLGGINAYQFTARYPDKVHAFIVEDTEVNINADMSFILSWAGTFRTRDELANRIGPRMLPYFEESFRKVADGWRLPFNPEDILKSVSCVNGDHWSAWLASECPALLLRGKDSRVTTKEQMEKMATRRSNTYFRILDGGHVIHQDNLDEYTEVVRKFLIEYGSGHSSQKVDRE